MFAAKFSFAQTPVSATTDTGKIIQIIRANNFRQKKIDSVTTLVMLAGDAVVKQGNTILSGDSIVLNQLTGVAEVFGNVHINDGDTVNTYAQYLKYLGSERMAYLKNNVKLTDGKAVLNTNELEYNLATGIAKYSKGGKVINGQTVLTSEDAVYYSDTKDVFFKNNVHLVDAKSDMVADSLRYNTLFREAYFISPTRIKTKDGVINTSSGTYNLDTGNAIFLDRTSFRDSTRFMSGDKIASDGKTGVIQIEGHGKLVDSVNSVTVLGGQILLDRKKNSFLATIKPVMILYRNNDSTYIAADTLYSGLRKYDSTQQKIINITDTLKKETAINISAVSDSVIKKNSSYDSTKKIPGTTDTLKKETVVKSEIKENSNSNISVKVTDKEINSTPPLTVEAVKGVLQKWELSQDRQSFSAYQDCYGSPFKGIKTTNKSETVYDYSGWMADRRKMLKTAVGLDIEIKNLNISIYGDLATVTFDQYYRSLRYSDWGPKEMKVKQTDKGARIVYENLKASYPLK